MSFDVDISHKVGDCRLSVIFTSNASRIGVNGPSGAGKTTLLHCIAGLITPDRGRIVVGGRTLFDSKRNISIPAHHRGAGYVFQDARLFPHMKVAANLAYGDRLRGAVLDHGGRQRIIETLAIGGLMNRWPANLSGGEVRRVAIARALLSNPKFLLLDEPLTSLDQMRSEEILTMIEQLGAALAIPMIYVSHHLAETRRLTETVITLGQALLPQGAPAR